MHQTTKKYQLGMETYAHVDTAIIEELRATDSNKNNGVTLIHAYGDTFLAEQDLRQKYNMPKNILLWQTRKMKNAAEFKLGAPADVHNPKVLFMANTANGMWDHRYPNYDARPERSMALSLIGVLHYFDPKFGDENWCVKAMLSEVTKPGLPVTRSYYRPVPNDFPVKSADMHILPNEEYNKALAEFDSAFNAAEIRMQKEQNTRGL